MDQAAVRLGDVTGKGDLRRFDDDLVFRYAVAYLWLRLTEPATQLLARRLVDGDALPRWSKLPFIRNSLAHDIDEDIDYPQLWESVPDVIEYIEPDVAALLSA
ncbi:MAG: hypothetical protein QG597_322 [Actinomycetota bacterium]|nr:hypothetical protein [Actinomycetota bacterium]